MRQKATPSLRRPGLVLLPVALVLGLGPEARGAPGPLPLPSHCRPGEFAVVDAWMGTPHATDGGWRSDGTGPLLSLCADRAREPFARLAYRFGRPGHVELEAIATPGTPFGIASRATSPHTGDDLVFFTRGDFTYYVAIAGGQGTGVSLHVFKGRRAVVDRFSGNEEDADYRLGPAVIDFDARPPASSSRVLVRARPRDAF